MCVILDTNTFSRFRDPNDKDMEPVREWLRRKNGKIVYSNTEKFKKEMKKGGMEHWIKERSRANQFKLVTEGVKEKEKELKDKIKSDDEHIIALALVTGVKILISYSEIKRGPKGDAPKGDGDLFDDFRDRSLIGGKVYTRKSHAQRMLTKDTCP